MSFIAPGGSQLILNVGGIEGQNRELPTQMRSFDIEMQLAGLFSRREVANQPGAENSQLNLTPH
jgi:hypothetical protein